MPFRNQRMSKRISGRAPQRRRPRPTDRRVALSIIRRAYAKQILAAAGVADRRLEMAFAATSREACLGPGPWPIFRGRAGYVPTPTADPVYLYTDSLVGIV